MFHDLTGRGVLDEPHHETDRAAYALAKEWTRFSPRYALGLAAKRAERLFEPESRILYWSDLRPGVLVGPRAAWFAARRDAICGAVDAFGAALAALALAGVALAAARRRLLPLSLLPFQLALAATYALFFAEPRYRLPIELLAFPFVALTLVELAGLVGAARGAPGLAPGARRGGRSSSRGATAVTFGAWAWPAAAPTRAPRSARATAGPRPYGSSTAGRGSRSGGQPTRPGPPRSSKVAPEVCAWAWATRARARRRSRSLSERTPSGPGTYALALEATGHGARPPAPERGGRRPSSPTSPCPPACPCPSSPPSRTAAAPSVSSSPSRATPARRSS